jgi:hypothetical protein
MSRAYIYRRRRCGLQLLQGHEESAACLRRPDRNRFVFEAGNQGFGRGVDIGTHCMSHAIRVPTADMLKNDKMQIVRMRDIGFVIEKMRKEKSDLAP